MKGSGWQNEPLRPAPEWLAPPNDVFIDRIMEGRWTGNEEHDKALQWAVYVTRGASDLCAILAAECWTGNDERMHGTTGTVRSCEENCQTAMVTLARWQTVDPDTLRSAVELCNETCAETSTEFQRYLRGLYSGQFKHPHKLRSTILLLRRVDSVLDDCREVCEGFLEVWFESRVDE